MRHLLIVGPPRSGTTLLASMVGRHDEVSMLIEDEGWAITKLVSKAVAANKLCIPNQIELQRRATLVETVLRKLGLRPPGPTSRRCIEDYLGLEGIRILAILRDGNAVISSIMRRGNQSLATASHRWTRAVDIVHALKQRLPDAVMVVSYERLVAKPEQSMREIARFLGLPFEPAMLEGYKYNPIYPGETGIDAERAQRHTRERIDYDLPSRYPEAVRRYRELVAAGGADAGE
jgi:hypothetical protein